MAQPNPYKHCLKDLTVDGKTYKYYSIKALNDPRVEKLPQSIKGLLECAIRNCDEFNITKKDVETILDWKKTCKLNLDCPFQPSRVVLQDFTGVPAVVDLAAMRDCMKNNFQADPNKINPAVPCDLVIDHSVAVDYSRIPVARIKNEELEFERNQERMEFLKWGQQAFKNFSIIPPGNGIVHQINLEYLGKVVFEKNGLLYHDSCVGTDSHTPMINGLGVIGWGVGGIEAEAVMMGENITMVLPEVIGFKLTGHLQSTVTATDLVLECVKMLRDKKVVGKFVEFYGPGFESLSLADRATVSNMAPEYGATMGFFPVDDKTLQYLKMTGKEEHIINRIKEYMLAQGLYYTKDIVVPNFTDTLELDLSKVQANIAGPKRPHDKVKLVDQKKDFTDCLTAKVGFKGFGLNPEQAQKTATLNYKGQSYTLKNGSIVIATITSCTNTSNPGVILGAGLLAKKAVEKGLSVPPYIKTSLSPGSRVVQKYINEAGLNIYFEQLGYYITGFGCQSCIGNSGELDQEVTDLINKEDIVAAAVLSGNRNFEGRIHALTKANYLASPPLVIAFSIAGRMDIDFEHEPLGKDKHGKDVFLRDIFPTREEINALLEKVVKPQFYQEVYGGITKGTEIWSKVKTITGIQFQWDQNSTYIHNPPFFKACHKQLPKIDNINQAYVLAYFGDFITTDHISPAGAIKKGSAASIYLESKGVKPADYNSFGSRRGNDEVMARGTFGNQKIINKLVSKVGPKTIYHPTGEEFEIYDVAEKYIKTGKQAIIIAGKDYGSGSSRDWAAKGPQLQGVKLVIAETFERIHRSNLIGMGIIPCEFKEGQTAESLNLTGKETYTIDIKHGNLKVHEMLTVKTNDGKIFEVKTRLDTAVEIEYIKHGGILHYVLRKMAKQ